MYGQYTESKARELFNLPENIIFDGVNIIPKSNDNIANLKRLEILEAYPMDGVSTKTQEKLLDTLLYNMNPINIFNSVIVNLDTLKQHFGDTQAINILNAIESYKETGIEPYQIIKTLCVDNSGTSISKEVAKKFEGVEYDYTHKNRKVIKELEGMQTKYETYKRMLIMFGYKINKIENPVEISNETIRYVMTGSPKTFGFKTKKEFQNVEKISKWMEEKSLNKDTTYLITDDLTSNSSKMKKAEKLGIRVLTYEQAIHSDLS